MENRAIFSNSVLKKPLRGSRPEEFSIERVPLCQQTGIVDASRFYQELSLPIDKLGKNIYPIEVAQKWLTLNGKNNKKYDFPLQAILPKVQLDRIVPPRCLPRDVEVDRRRREYAKLNLEELLQEVGLTNKELMPTEEQFELLSSNYFKHIFPLSFFDDTNFDCHSPEAWMNLGIVDNKQYPLPAKAFVPYKRGLIRYAWQNVAVYSYDANTDKWEVLVLDDDSIYHIAKIQIMFFAENPHTFVKRLLQANERRTKGEALLCMEAIVDCVIYKKFQDKIFHPNKLVERLMKTVKGDARITKIIRREIYLLFEHLMVLFDFENVLRDMPNEFPNITPELIRSILPKAYPSLQSKHDREMLKSLQLDLKTRRYNVRKASLFYILAGIEAMINVSVECQVVEVMNMFLCSFAKALPLQDFLQLQQQYSSNAANYLKNMWPEKVSMGISFVLRRLGKGWLDIGLSKWKVYMMCKISKFLLQVKFRMQDAVQSLLERSIINFSLSLCEPCKQFLKIKDNFTWTSDFIESHFPYHKPVFSLFIGVNEERKVFYSTSPEEFEPALSEIFKKALEKTSGVRIIDAETMTNLRFAPNLCILTVELIEDLYIQHAELLSLSYKKAMIPLVAYAKLYERFIDFYLLNVNEHMNKYTAQKTSSANVKRDILEHKRQKAELREILPTTIVIGPFHVNVDPMKQLMIKKHTEIVKRLFEYYVQRMYDINEAILEECLEVYNKITERPFSIEQLYEIRDFSMTVPDRVEQLRSDIQIMFLEYEMLDSFFYNLSDAQFAMKWDAFAWPQKILNRLTPLREEQKVDIEEFKRLHLSEISGFEERLESLNDEIQAFSLMFDPNKVLETSVEVKKTWKTITELQKTGATLAYRQKLFEMDDLSLEFLESIVDSFTPYRNLWLTCADFIKLEDATIGNPLLNIELVEVWLSIEEIRRSLEESEEVFREKPEVQNVATVFLKKLNDFIPVYNCIKWLKNEHWLAFHWQELNNRAGTDIKYSIAMNFQYCMRKGIMSHLDLVQEISDKAEAVADELKRQAEEEERRRALEQEALFRRKEARKCRRDIL